MIKWGYQSKFLDHHFERTMSIIKILLENNEKLKFKKIKSLKTKKLDIQTVLFQRTGIINKT